MSAVEKLYFQQEFLCRHGLGPPRTCAPTLAVSIWYVKFPIVSETVSDFPRQRSMLVALKTIDRMVADLVFAASSQVSIVSSQPKYCGLRTGELHAGRNRRPARP